MHKKYPLTSLYAALQIENVMKENPFTIGIKTTNYLVINLTRNVEDIFLKTSNCTVG